MTNEGEEFGTIGVYQKSGYQGESRCVPPRRTIPYRSRLLCGTPYPRLGLPVLPGMSLLAPLAMGPPVGYMGSSTVRIRTLLNNHVPPYTRATSPFLPLIPNSAKGVK